MLSNNNIFKKCKRCNRYISKKRSERFSSKKKTPNPRPIRSAYCKDCRNTLRLIQLFKKKYFIISQIYTGKCSECETGLEYLPSFEFHHPKPSIKTNIWTHIKHRNIYKIIDWINKENVILLCSNCHELKRDKYFKDFKELINIKNLFEHSAEEIDNLINSAIIRHPNYQNFSEFQRNIKIQIKKYIRKRYVFNKLFSGKCIGCGISGVTNSLPILELHHLKPESLTNKSNWGEIANQDCSSIIHHINEENCVCLCSNCHTLIRSKIESILDEVIEDKNLRYLIATNLKTIITNINNFNFNHSKIKFNSPLKLKFSQDEFWKIHLIQVAIFLKNNGRDNFKVLNLVEFLNHKPRSVRFYLDRLITLNYIIKTKGSAFPFDNSYRLTDLGKSFLLKLKLNYSKTYTDLTEDITCMEDYMSKQKKWRN